MMRNLGCPQSEEQIKKLIAGVDTDGNGMIEFDEFVGIMGSRMLKSEGETEIDQAFSLLDDHSGTFHVDSLRHLMCEMGSSKLSVAEVDGLIATLQPDAEGRVSMEAFKKLDCWSVPVPTMEAQQGFRKTKSRTDLPSADAPGSG